MNIYYDFTKLDEFFGIAPSDPIEILSEEEAIEQGMIEPLEGGWSGVSNPNYKDGLWSNNPKESKRRWHQENKEKNREKRNQYNKQYYKENKERINEQRKERAKEYRLENREKISEYNKRYYQENKTT